MSLASKALIALAGLALTVLLTGCYADHSPGAVALARTKARVDVFCAAIETYREDHKALPSESQGLEITLSADKRSSENLVLRDGWGRLLRPLASDSLIIGVYSAGQNGKDEGGRGDDISCRVTEKR